MNNDYDFDKIRHLITPTRKQKLLKRLARPSFAKILLYLCMICKKDEIVDVNWSQIQSACDMEDATLSKTLRDMINLGLIERDRHKTSTLTPSKDREGKFKVLRYEKRAYNTVVGHTDVRDLIDDVFDDEDEPVNKEQSKNGKSKEKKI
jgi:predicted transcriptional regulator